MKNLIKIGYKNSKEFAIKIRKQPQSPKNYYTSLDIGGKQNIHRDFTLVHSNNFFNNADGEKNISTLR